MKETIDLFNLSGSIAIVTGGLGQIGRQFSSILSLYGVRVAVFDLNVDKNIKDTKNIKYFNVDITKKAQIEIALRKVQKLWGTPDILINNAAIDSPPSFDSKYNLPFEQMSESIFDLIIDVNIKGSVLCSQVVGSAMAKKGKGSIINMSSIYGVLSPNHSIYSYKNKGSLAWYKPIAYSVSKSAIINLTKYLSTYWAKKGVRVNSITPSGIFNNQDEEFINNYTKQIPIGRMADETELNGTVIYLASEASSFVTGANIVVDGGWTAW